MSPWWSIRAQRGVEVISRTVGVSQKDVVGSKLGI